VSGDVHDFRPRSARQLAALSHRAAEMAQAAQDDKDERDAALNASRALHIAASVNGELEDARRWLAETARPDLRERAFQIFRELTAAKPPDHPGGNAGAASTGERS
jgi:hypothetical protein